MNIRNIFLLIALSALLPGVSYADGGSRPIMYSRTNITVVRKTLPPPPPSLPWLNKPAQPENPAVGFDIEVRDALTFYREKGWFNLSGPTENSGVLLIFNAPTVSPIVHSTQYAPLDILMVDAEGKIIQIIPGIKLSDLDQDILPPSPILAFLFLKGGTCAHFSINPGDKIEYPIFRHPPLIVNTPRPPAPNNTQDAPVKALSPPAQLTPLVPTVPSKN